MRFGQNTIEHENHTKISNVVIKETKRMVVQKQDLEFLSIHCKTQEAYNLTFNYRVECFQVDSTLHLMQFHLLLLLGSSSYR